MSDIVHLTEWVAPALSRYSELTDSLMSCHFIIVSLLFNGMQRLDLNLLLTLDALLAERSVTRAAERLNLTPPAVSHALGRLRVALDDPLLVRAGQRLVPTARARDIQENVRELVERARTIFRQERPPKLSQEHRTVVIRADDAIISAYAAKLACRIHAEAPDVRLHFKGRLDEGPEPLRNGTVDLDIGIEGDMAPEICTERLCETPLVGVCHADHRFVSGIVPVPSFAKAIHVVASRRGRAAGPIDRRLMEVGLSRSVSIIVPDAVTALAVVAQTEHVTVIPSLIADWGRTTMGLASFPLPVSVPPIAIILSWHPRLAGDPVHQWLRGCFRQVFK